LRRISFDIVGIDHGFSFPLHYFEVHGLLPDWPTFLDDFQLNTDYHPGPSEKAVSRGEEREHAAQRTLAVSALFRVPHDEASRRAGCGKSARPVR
jgi:hypothetical protein